MAYGRRIRKRREECLVFRDQPVRLIRRAFQRRMRATVKLNGEVLLTTDLGTSVEVVKEFLQEAWPWVEKHRARSDRMRERFPAKRFSEGETFEYLGLPLILKFLPSPRKRLEVRREDHYLVALVPQNMWENFDPRVSHPEWREPVRRFYEAQGRLLIASRVEVFARLMNAWPTALRFRCQRTRWGSCTQAGRVSLNWRLVAAPLAVLDYVVIHELSHLRHPNHSAAFWEMVEKFCPDYRTHEAWLKDRYMALEFLQRQGGAGVQPHAPG
jgi:predicted metal-dependent hydrolase